jgi:phospholipid N-methyltransferase
MTTESVSRPVCWPSGEAMNYGDATGMIGPKQLTRDHRDDHLGEPRLEVICLYDKRRAKLGGT